MSNSTIPATDYSNRDTMPQYWMESHGVPITQTAPPPLTDAMDSDLSRTVPSDLYFLPESFAGLDSDWGALDGPPAGVSSPVIQDGSILSFLTQISSLDYFGVTPSFSQSIEELFPPYDPYASTSVGFTDVAYRSYAGQVPLITNPVHLNIGTNHFAAEEDHVSHRPTHIFPSDVHLLSPLERSDNRSTTSRSQQLPSLSERPIPPTPILPSNSTTHDFLSLIHRKKRGERNLVDESLLSTAFKEGSSYPDPQRRALFEMIPRLLFYQDQALEPTLDTAEARTILSAAGTPGLACDAPKRASIFALFLERESNRCLVCGKSHGTLERALGCVRMHLCHRPFACKGAGDGCNACAMSK
ncbi:hypothetical protein FRC17_006066 [Serendipita sp. 399]|nr:hypothetical protein FRC17_006066 [Serendipita sp. 399]